MKEKKIETLPGIGVAGSIGGMYGNGCVARTARHPAISCRRRSGASVAAAIAAAGIEAGARVGRVDGGAVAAAAAPGGGVVG